ncbi:MAG TPA: alpha/beta fold hydrolase [Candidatus Stackebrandtia faecavium]|nr:alpha/beta fold hydrolase [Candidatus Stackebrandtia faecavium]
MTARTTLRRLLRSSTKTRPRLAITILLAVAVVASICVASLTSLSSTHTTRDFTLHSDGDEPVDLDATIYMPDTDPAPAVLLAHGFGGTKESVAEQAATLADHGFVVLTYTARGFGESTGTIHLNAPDYEVADASAAIDYLAEHPGVVTDDTNDPRVAVAGGSYGGALALLAAGHDDRIDAIAPQVTWNSLADALFPNHARGADGGVFKQQWAGLFYSGGLAGGAAGPRAAPGPGGPPPDGEAGEETDDETAQQPPTQLPDPNADPACGRWAPDVCQMYQRIAASGELDAEAEQLLDASSPESVLGDITAPTLLVQGQADTLFGLDQADANAEGITNAPVKVAWYSGGHDATGTGADADRIDALTVQWLDHHLRGNGDEPDAAFDFSRIAGATSSRSDLATLSLQAPQYPGLDGSDEPTIADATNEVGPQTVASPPDGTPAALSSLPSLGQLSMLGGGLTREVPGQFGATDYAVSGDEPVDIVGAPTVKLKAASKTGEATLFVKLYDVGSDGSQTLPNGLIAPVKLEDLPESIDDAEPVTVTLPGIVHRLEPGHTLRLVVATSDQAYAGPAEAAQYTVELPQTMSLPTTPAQPLPGGDAAWRAALVASLIGIPLLAFGAWLAARIRHKRRDRSVDPQTAHTPLVVDNLRKVYQDGYVAVDDVSFRVEQGQVVGLLGPNGAGKTTSLRVLMGLLQPTDGQMRVFGHRVTPGAPVLSRLGALVEGPGLLPHLSGMDNLRLYWQATGRPNDEAEFDTVVEIAGLGDRIHRKVRTYSHGMKQRIAIAQAMLGLPQLLVLDEPTDGLDPPQIAEMRKVLHEYARDGRAVLVSSHLLAEVEQTCTHVVVMRRGTVAATGPVRDVIKSGDGRRLEDAFLELVEES